MLTWSGPPVGRARAKNHWPAKRALRVGKTHLEHMLRAEGFFALRPARELRAARFNARRFAEVVRLRPAHEETATRTPLTDMEMSETESLTSSRKMMSLRE